MRHISATAVMLIFALGMLAPACVAGWNDGSGCQSAVVSCHRKAKAKPTLLHPLKSQSSQPQQSNIGIVGDTGSNTAITRASAFKSGKLCGDAFTARPGQCGLRTFIQLHFVGFRAGEISLPLVKATKVSMPSRVMIIVSSVGPPETDRGPPYC